MAIIKINRSQSRVNAAQTPNLSALAMDQNVMINYGNSIAQVGKVNHAGLNSGHAPSFPIARGRPTRLVT